MEITENTCSEELISYFDISHKSAYDGPGIRVVVFLQSCNADCIWCHSPHSQLSKSPLLFFKRNCSMCQRCKSVCKNNVHSFENNKHIINRENCTKCGDCIEACPNSSNYRSVGTLSLPTKKIPVSKLFKKILPHLKMFKDIGGITLSGGEALLQKKAVVQLLNMCKEYEINTAIETSGLLPQNLYTELESLVDCWLYGMRFTTNYPNNDHSILIENSFKIIKSYNKKILCRIPVVYGHTDSEWYLEKSLNFLKKNNINSIFISPWNIHTDHYYKFSGIKEKMIMPSLEESLESEKRIRNFFIKNNIKTIEIEDYE